MPDDSKLQAGGDVGDFVGPWQRGGRNPRALGRMAEIGARARRHHVEIKACVRRSGPAGGEEIHANDVPALLRSPG